MNRLILLLILITTLVGCSLFEDDSPAFPPREDLPAPTTFGNDWLAAQHPLFNLGAALEEYEGRRPIGTLDNTFGTDLAPIRLILGSGKVNHYRVHFINGPCIRNRNCGSYEIFGRTDIDNFNRAVERRDEGIRSSFQARVAEYCSLIPEYPSVRFYFSWVLEHNLSVAAWNVLDEWGRAACDRNDYYVVNNPVGSHTFPPYPRAGVLYESHNFPEAGNQIHGLDGREVNDIDLGNWKRDTINSGAGLGFVWTFAFNCRVQNAPFVDPRARTECPTREEHRYYNSLSTDTPEVPEFRETRANFRDGGGGYLWKPVAESRPECVILLDEKHQRDFVCKAPLRSGGFDTLRFTGYHNGNRQHHRCNQRCNRYSRPEVVCENASEKLTVSASGSPCDRKD